MRFISSWGRNKSCIQTLAILALCLFAWVGVVEAQGITPGKWVGGNPSSEDPYFICLNVSDDGQRLTAVGTQCTGNQGQNRNSIDIQWQGGKTPYDERCNQSSYRRADQGDLQIGSDGTFVHTFSNADISTTVSGRFDAAQGTVSGTAHSVNQWIDCKVEWTAAPASGGPGPTLPPPAATPPKRPPASGVQGISPGQWTGGNPDSENPYYMCLNVSDDGQRLTAVGTQCTGDQGTNRNALDIQWQAGKTPQGDRCNQYSYRRADQGDVQIASDGTFVHTFKNARVNTTVTGRFNATEGTVSGTARTINPYIDCQVEWSATPTNPTEPTTPTQRENVEAFVTRFYQFVLNRSPEAAGLKDWTDKLISQTLVGADVAEGFIYSQEFINRNTTDEQYLNILYKAFFDRGPDQEGWNTWLPEIQSGEGRGYVLDGFLGSQEFSKLSQRFGIIPK